MKKLKFIAVFITAIFCFEKSYSNELNYKINCSLNALCPSINVTMVSVTPPDTCNYASCYIFNNTDLKMWYNVLQSTCIKLGLSMPDSCNPLICPGRVWNNTDNIMIYAELIKIKRYLIAGGGGGTDTSKVPLNGTAAGHPLRNRIVFNPPYASATVIGDSLTNDMYLGWAGNTLSALTSTVGCGVDLNPNGSATIKSINTSTGNTGLFNVATNEILSYAQSGSHTGSFKIYPDTFIVTGKLSAFRGVKYNADYSANYDSLSHITWQDLHRYKTSGGGGITPVTSSTSQYLPMFAGTSNKVKNSPAFTDTTKKNTFYVGRKSIWQTDAVGYYPAQCFANDTNALSGLSIENNNTGNRARAGLSIIGVSRDTSGVKDGQYILLNVTSPTYSQSPQLKNSGSIQFGGTLNRGEIYSDTYTGLGIGAYDSVASGLNYFPDAISVIHGSSCYVGINHPSKIVDPLTVRGAITSTSLGNGSSLYHLPIADNTGHLYNDDKCQWALDNYTLRLTSQRCPTNNAFYGTGIDANGDVISQTSAVYNVSDGVLTPLITYSTSGASAACEVKSTASTGSSFINLGSYNNTLYGQLRTFNASFSTAYPFVANDMLLWNRGGALDIGTYDNYQITFFTNATEKANFNSSGRLFVGGSTSAGSLLQLGAGSTAANTAPLQFTQGTRETSARAGVMEFDSMLYFTPNTSLGRWAIAINSNQYVTPATGATVTATQHVSNLICNPSGSLVNLTINFPAHPRDGDVFSIEISQIVTSTVLATTDGSTIKGTMVTSSANSHAGWVYNVTSTTWYQRN